MELESYAFARLQNNSDDHLFDYLVSNIKESEINKMSLANIIIYNGCTGFFW